jgi:hypothetical protein
MKRFLSGMIVMILLVMTGCGDSTVTVVAPLVSPPTITSFEFVQNRTTFFINGSINFHAPDSDIDTMTVVVFNSQGVETFRATTVLNLPGVITGTIPFSIDYVTFPPDLYTFSIFITDFNGNTSNQVVDTFRVP